MTDDLFEGHGPAKGDHQLRRRQRRSAPVEEVVLPADPVRRDAKHSRPCRRHALLGCRGWRLDAIAGGAELPSERREGLAVGLAIRGQRQTFAPVEGGRDHVRRQGLTELILQKIGLKPLTGVESNQLLAALPPGDHHRAAAHARNLQQAALDLAKLDAESAHLDLCIPPAKELQLAVRLPTPEVTAPVEALAVANRIADESSPRAFWIVDVSAPDANT